MQALFVNAPSTGVAGVQFSISVSAVLRNNGPEATVLVDTAFVPTLPADCSATFGAITIQDSALPLGINVSISRSWMVTCTQPGPHAFTMDAMAAIDPLQPATDPNPGNNSMSANDTTQIN